MSTYQGEERRDQRPVGKDIRKLLDDIEKYRVITRDDFAVLASELAAAWRLGFERGRSAGAKEVMEHVELELGALREGLKED